MNHSLWLADSRPMIAPVTKLRINIKKIVMCLHNFDSRKKDSHLSNEAKPEKYRSMIGSNACLPMKQASPNIFTDMVKSL